MYVESLLTFRNIDVTAPTIGATVGYSKIYVGDDTLYHAYYDEIGGSTIDRVTSVRVADLVDNGLVFFNSVEGGRDRFTCFSPNLTTTQLVLASSGDGAANPSFEWVDINDWIPTIPDVYWSRNIYGLYPTTSTDKVAIGKVPTDTDLPAGTTLYLHEGLRVNVGAVSVGTGSILTQAGNVFTLSGNIYTSNGYIRALDGDIYSTLGNIYATEGNIYTSNGSIGVKQGFLYIDQTTSEYSSGLDDALSIHLLFGIEDSTFNSESIYYKARGRSLENIMNDSGYGFKRVTSSTTKTDTWTVDCSVSEIQYATLVLDAEDEFTISFTYPKVNKIVTLVVRGNLFLPDIELSGVTVLSGKFNNTTDVHYIQVMCINDSPVEYIATINTPVTDYKSSGLTLTSLTDLPNDYLLDKDKYVRINGTGTAATFKNLTSADSAVTEGNIPYWSDISGCSLSNGYGISSDLATDYTSSYLATADVIKDAIDTQKVQSVSASATIEEDTKIILVDKSAGDVTLTFPDLESATRARTWKIKDITASDNTNDVIIAIEGTTYTIEGQSTLTITGNNFARDVIFLNNYYIA